MTNEEKFKTPEERLKQFRKYCADTECANCKMRPSGVRMPFVDNCALHWLALEAEEENPIPCPFCGENNINIFETDFGRSDEPYQFAVKCSSCGALVSAEDRDAAIAAWNRRAK